MFCSHCGTRLAAGAAACTVCASPAPSGVPTTGAGDLTILSPSPGAQFATSSAATMAGGGAPSGVQHISPPAGATSAGVAGGGTIPGSPLSPGTAFGSRYHIIRLLGVGGMGAVYQAWDDALGVAVALKVIRPEITADPAAARDLERRFKRELLLARQVTHKNVVRIHDLGEIDGIKYLTMPYIQGSDLSSILGKEGKLAVRRAVAIAKQVVGGLAAAHEAGVVHRDLKPANIMVDADDQAVIMDFGIARSVSGGGATVAGAVVGTLEYMAPEQAMAQPVDHRADIYALGLILYDMVLGPRHASRAESAVAELMARVQKPLPPARAIDSTVPEALERIIDRCTQPDPGARYDTTAQLAHDLELLDAGGRQAPGTGTLSAPPITRTTQAHAPATAPSRAVPRKAVLAAIVLIAVAAGAWLLISGLPRTDQTTAVVGDRPLALAVLPFRNATGDGSLDWLGPTLADWIGGEIGQSARLRLVSSERVFQLLRDLGVAHNAEIDAGTVRRVSEFSNADSIVAGRFVQLGDEIRIDVTVHGSGSEPVVLSASAAGQNDLLRAARGLAGAVQKTLALSASAVRELEANALQPSSESVVALRHYGEGLHRARAGEYLEAANQFQASAEADPRFALAFSRLGQALSRLGKSEDAERASRTAVGLSADLPAAERDLIVGAHARITNDLDSAIGSYERLVQVRPTDVQLRFELADLLERKGVLERARDEYARVIELDPKFGDALYGAGRVAIKRGDFEQSLEPLNRALTLSVQLDNREAKAQVLQGLGIAYKNLNKLDDALRQYRESLEIKRQIGDRRGIAASLGEIAQIHERQGRADEAVVSYTEALEIRRTIGDNRGVGLTLINLGASYLDRAKYDEALATFREALQIQREIGDEEGQALCLSNIGNAYLARGQYEESRTNLERALELRQKLSVPGTTALTLNALADVSTKLGEYGTAEKQYLRAIELWRGAADRRGVAIGTYGLGELRAQQGRFRAAVQAKAEALGVFRELNDRSYWFGEILTGHGSALVQAGRREEAGEALAEALAFARELRNQTLIARALTLQGDHAFLFGDATRARSLFEEALQAGRAAGHRFHLLRAQLSQLRMAAYEGRPNAAAELRKLMRETDGLGLRHLSAEASVYLGKALLASREASQSRTELESSLARCERLDARLLLGLAHSFLGQAASALGDKPAETRHFGQAREIFEGIRQETGGETVFARRDVKSALDVTSRTNGSK